jgi:hypothetical protein
MTTFMNNLNKQLFTELTPTESAVIQGGAEEFRGYIAGKETTTPTFNVDAGSDLKLSSFTSYIGEYNSGFYAELQNKTSGEEYKKWVSIGNQTTFWTGLTGGSNDYKMQFRDGQGNIISSRPEESAVISSGNY